MTRITLPIEEVGAYLVLARAQEAFASGLVLYWTANNIITFTQQYLIMRSQGIEVLACGTCLDYYGLKDQLAVGEISNMYTIAETMLGAGRIVQL